MEQNVNNNERLFLEEVTLSGYKSIYNTNITFNKGINIIIGKNAVGKTNFFSFLFKIINLLYKDLYNFQSTLLLKNGSKLQINAKNYIPLDAVRLEKLKNIEDKNTIPLFGEGIFDTNTFVQLDGKFIINDFIERNIYLALLNNNIWYNPTFLKHGIPHQTSRSFFLSPNRATLNCAPANKISPEI